MDFLKDYHFNNNYHLRKTNLVADALNRKVFKSSSLIAYINIQRNYMMTNLIYMKLEFLYDTNKSFLTYLIAQLYFIQNIKKSHKKDIYLHIIAKKIV